MWLFCCTPLRAPSLGTLTGIAAGQPIRVWDATISEQGFMTKSAIIATCLVNSNMISNLEDAENQVRAVFLEEFPNSHFYLWNGNVNDASAANIIKNVG